MAAYALTSDVQARMMRTMGSDELSVCSKLLDDVAVLIDAVAADAAADKKLIVSCRAVIRALGDGGASSVPVGATQGQMSALGYQQSWTFGYGSTGELYLSKMEKQLLGKTGSIGSRSPVEDLAEVGADV